MPPNLRRHFGWTLANTLQGWCSPRGGSSGEIAERAIAQIARGKNQARRAKRGLLVFALCPWGEACSSQERRQHLLACLCPFGRAETGSSARFQRAESLSMWRCKREQSCCPVGGAVRATPMRSVGVGSPPLSWAMSSGFSHVRFCRPRPWKGVASRALHEAIGVSAGLVGPDAAGVAACRGESPATYRGQRRRPRIARDMPMRYVAPEAWGPQGRGGRVRARSASVVKSVPTLRGATGGAPRRCLVATPAVAQGSTRVR